MSEIDEQIAELDASYWQVVRAGGTPSPELRAQLRSLKTQRKAELIGEHPDIDDIDDEQGG